MISINNFNNDSYRCNFTSRANPIAPLLVDTKIGKIKIYEIDYDKDVTPKFMRKITHFFCKNFSLDTPDPFWQKYKTFNPIKKFKMFKTFFNYYANKILKSERPEHVTILVAKDEKNKLHGVCLAYACDEIPGAINSALYLDSIATSKKYRGKGLAKIMMQEIHKANAKSFGDSFLTAAIESKEFYEKLGYQLFNTENFEQSKVLEFIAQNRTDYPKYMEPYNLPLNKNSGKWFTESVEAITDLENLAN